MKRSPGSSKDDVLQLLGLIARARKLLLGEEILKRFKDVRLLIMASDISEKSRERYLKKCHHYQISCIDLYDGSQLSAAIGKSNVKTIGIIDDGFTEAILRKMN